MKKWMILSMLTVAALAHTAFADNAEDADWVSKRFCTNSRQEAQDVLVKVLKVVDRDITRLAQNYPDYSDLQNDLIPFLRISTQQLLTQAQAQGAEWNCVSTHHAIMGLQRNVQYLQAYFYTLANSKSE